MNPTTKQEKVTSSIFDLDSMSDVTLFKNLEFSPVNSTQEALSAVGGDAKKFLAIINEGLRQHVRESAKSDSTIPWMQEQEEGEPTQFTGTPADSKAVNSLVLTLAKTIFGYSKDATSEAKSAAKASAMAMISSNEQIKKGLKENAAA
jgi:hypothetical protein